MFTVCCGRRCQKRPRASSFLPLLSSLGFPRDSFLNEVREGWRGLELGMYVPSARSASLVK